MSVSKLPSGRWRAQVWDPVLGRNRSVGTYGTKAEAKKARENARGGTRRTTVTVGEFRDRWITDPLFARPKESTNLHYAQQVKAFCDKHARLPLAGVTDDHVSAWIADPRTHGTVPKLRAMFNDAMSPKAGRLIDRNPFARLGLEQTKGNQGIAPPSEKTVAELVDASRRVAGPYFAGWIAVGAYTGMRPGELDALRWERINFEAGEIDVAEQWSAKARKFTLPKRGRRTAILTPQARDILLALPRDPSGFCFVNLRGTHWTPSSRASHWKATRAAVGYDDTLYLATRHHAGWFMVNVLGLTPEDVAVALGHRDGGYLVRTLYGHLDERLARDRVRSAYENRSNVTPLRQKRESA